MTSVAGPVPWDEQGCAVCRREWESGTAPRLIDESSEDRSSLHRCDECGTLWLRTERYAVVMEPEDLPAAYAGALSGLLAEAAGGAVPTRYFVRHRRDGGVLIPFALLRRRVEDGVTVDEVLRDADSWGVDGNGSVDRAIRFPLDADLEEVDRARAQEFIGMVAERVYRPFA